MSTVQSIERAFAILNALAASGDGLGVTALSRQLGLPKSTVSRLLGTLEGLSAVERYPTRDRFRIGGGVLALVLQVPFYQRLATLARPFLQNLAEQLGEDVALCVPQGDFSYYADQVHRDSAVQVKNWTGAQFPLHVLAAGRLFLAARTEVEIEAYLKRPLLAHSPRTPTDPAQLRIRLKQIRQDGVDWSLEEFAPDLNAVAVPIYNETEHTVAAVNVFGPSFRFPRQGDYAGVTKLLQKTAADIMTNSLRQR